MLEEKRINILDDAKNTSAGLYSECILDDVLERKKDDVIQNVKDYVKYYISLSGDEKSEHSIC